MEGVALFSIGEILSFGDPTNGESQQVTISHDCEIVGGTKLPAIWFTKALSGKQTVVCPHCNKSTPVKKEGGNILPLPEN